MTEACLPGLTDNNLLFFHKPCTQGIGFAEFTLHLSLGIVFCLVSAYILLFAIYYFHFVRVKNRDPPHISELKREVAIWERTAQRLNVVSLEERAVRDALLQKATEVRSQISLEQNSTMQSAQDLWKENLKVLETKYCITDYILLVKSSIVLLVVILLFFLSNIIPMFELDLGKSYLAVQLYRITVSQMILQDGLPYLEQWCC